MFGRPLRAGFRAAALGGRGPIRTANGITTPAFGVSNLAGIYGDSLTEHDFGVTPWYWQMGMQGGKLRTIVNGGLSGQTIFGLISQLDSNAYTDYFGAGLVGLPDVGWLGLRIGTNGVGTAISGSDRTNYQSIVDRLLTKAEHVIVFSIPPRGGVMTTATYADGYNTFLRDVLVPSNPRLHWVDDCADIRDPSDPNKVLPEFFQSDEIHFNAAGVYQCGLTAQAALTELFSLQAYASRLVTSNADVYPTTTQWLANPEGIGTSGTAENGYTGSVQTGHYVGTGGGGTTAGVASVVAADVDDPNEVPWQRITPSAVSSNGYTVFVVGATGRTMTSGDPSVWDQIMQVRLNAVDPSKLWRIRSWFQDSGGTRVSQISSLLFGGWPGGLITATAVMQQEYPRIAPSSTVGGGLVCYIDGAADYSGSVGSIDFRCASIRG